MPERAVKLKGVIEIEGTVDVPNPVGGTAASELPPIFAEGEKLVLLNPTLTVAPVNPVPPVAFFIIHQVHGSWVQATRLTAAGVEVPGTYWMQPHVGERAGMHWVKFGYQ